MSIINITLFERVLDDYSPKNGWQRNVFTFLFLEHIYFPPI